MKKAEENLGSLKQKRQLARWIRKGWAQDYTGFKFRYMIIEHEKYSILLWTLKFALLGKIPSNLRGTNRSREESMAHLVKARDRLHYHVAGTSDPFQAMAEFFGITKAVLKKIGDLEGPYEAKKALEIADILERGEI